MSEFTLNGKTKQKRGKWCAEITLSTPDGKSTVIESGFVYSTDKEAENNLKFNLVRIMDDFKTQGVEVVSHTEGVVQ